jgi:hypothetical protein
MVVTKGNVHADIRIYMQIMQESFSNFHIHVKEARNQVPAVRGGRFSGNFRRTLRRGEPGRTQRRRWGRMRWELRELRIGL